MDDPSGQSGYYREIARAFLKRRGGGLVLSPKDQAVIAAWEEKRIPLDAVLEGIERTFDGLKARGRATRTVPLSFCDRAVESAFVQHKDRAAGRRPPPITAPKPDKSERARREIGKSLKALDEDGTGVRRLLEEALGVLAASAPDAAALERLDAEIEALLWDCATEAEKAAAAAEARRMVKGRAAERGHVPGTCPPAGGDDAVRRQAVMAARARRRIPHVSLHFY